jgi:hypothetical protein
MAVREAISDNYIENSYIIKLCNSSAEMDMLILSEGNEHT